MRKLNDEERLASVEAKVIRGPGCHGWTGTVDSCGYPMVSWRAGGRVTMHASRFLWIAKRGPIPEGRYLLHSCDNSGCMNLDHLRVGTQAENAMDAVRRGRHRGTSGKRWTYVLVEGKRRKRG